MKRLVILLVAPRYHTNQVGIVRALLSHGHDVHFHVRTKGFIEDYSLIEPIIFPESWITFLVRRLFGEGGANNKRYMPSPVIYWQALKKLKPDIVIIRKHGLAFTYLAAFYSKLLNCRIIFYGQVDTLYFEKFKHKSILGKLRKIIFNLPLLVFKAAFITPLLSKKHSSLSLPKHCYFLPFSVEIKNRYYRNNSKLRFLTIGKFVPRKNHLLVVNTAIKLASEYDFTITIVGEVSTQEHQNQLESIKCRIESLGLENRIILRYNIKHRDIEKIYREHDVFLLPACNEPAAISPLEAMGFGLPVICTDSCGTKTYIEDGINGFIVETDNEDLLKDKMEYFLKDISRVTIMSEKAYSYAEVSLSDRNYYKMFQTIVNKEIKQYK